MTNEHWPEHSRAAYCDWPGWPKDRQLSVATRVAIDTVREIGSRCPGLSAVERNRCKDAGTLDLALAAAMLAVVRTDSEPVARAAAAAMKAQAGFPDAALHNAAAAAMAAAKEWHGDSEKIRAIARDLWIRATND